MSRLARYTKAPPERKRYQIDYTDWLDTGETVANVVFSFVNQTATSLIVVDGVAVLPTALGVQYYISGGLDGTTYEILATLTTSLGQIREDAILVSVKEP